MAIYPPGSQTPIYSGCTYYEFGPTLSVSTNQQLSAGGAYTIVVTESVNAVVTYSLSLERVNPAPSSAVALMINQTTNGAVTAPTEQNAFTFNGATTGTYRITASITGGPSNVCFDVYQPDGTNVVSGNCTYFQFGPVLSVYSDITPTEDGTYTILAYDGGNDGTVNYTMDVACYLGTCPTKPPKCTLSDSLSYSSGTLTMTFTLGTPYAATWNVWLNSGNNIESLVSQAQPVTEPPQTITQTASIPASGTVGVLSTLTTSTGGIKCSSWKTISTGKP